MTPLVATASAAPMLLFLLGTSVMLAFALPLAQRRLLALWRSLRRLVPRAAALLGVALLVLFVQIGGSLNKNPPDGPNPLPPLPGLPLPPLPGEGTVTDSATNVVYCVDSLAVTEFSVSSNVLSFGIAWNDSEAIPGRRLDVYHSPTPLDGPWSLIHTQDVGSGTSNVFFSVVCADTNVCGRATGFFRIGTRIDIDGDGTPDAWEAMNGLNPLSPSDAYADADGDGIPNLYEFGQGLNPNVPDSVNARILHVGGTVADYATLGDAFRASEPYDIIEIAPGTYSGTGWTGLDFPQHPVMVTSPDGGQGRGVVIQDNRNLMLYRLSDGQSNHTIVQGIRFDLLLDHGGQIAFFCGGNTPWTGAASSALFRNVHVRMPHPGVKYMGWHFRHHHANGIVLSGCTVNAAGATDARGVYLIDSPPVTIEHCTFLNFPVLGNETANYAVQCETTCENLGNTTNDVPVRVSNCLFDESFTNAYPVAILTNGVPYDVVFERSIVPSALPPESGTVNDLIVTNALVSWCGLLAANSPAINAGTAPLYSHYDMEGDPRDAHADIGADEYTARDYANLDSDGDGYTDADELEEYGTDPYAADSDFDGLSDPYERDPDHGSDPADYKSQYVEVNVQLLAMNDGIGESVTNYVAYGFERNGWESNSVAAFLNLFSTTFRFTTTTGVAMVKVYRDVNKNGAFDEDADVLYTYRVMPNEIPVQATYSIGDQDGDGLSDRYEQLLGTNPYRPDTDGDGQSDGDEVDKGSDPLNLLSRYVDVEIVIEDRDPSALPPDTTNYVCCAMAPSPWGNINPMPFTHSTILTNSFITTTGKAVVQYYTDFNKNGVFDAGVETFRSNLISTASTRKTTKIILGDADNDMIGDSVELAHGSDPNDAHVHCCAFTLTVTNRWNDDATLCATAYTNRVSPETVWMHSSVVTGRVQTVFNVHTVFTNVTKVLSVVYADMNSNGMFDATSDIGKVKSVVLAGHEDGIVFDTESFDGDCDGMPDLWEFHEGFSWTDLQDSFDDSDGDGLPNHFEYEFGFDPHSIDAANTLVAAACRSIDNRIDGLTASRATKALFNSYVPNARQGVFVPNTTCWAHGIDLSCASHWWNNWTYGMQKTGTLISPRHVLMATHYALGVGCELVFVATNGTVRTATISATNHVNTVNGDFCVGLLAEDVPGDVVPARILPQNYLPYLGTDQKLPVLCLDQEEKCLVLETTTFSGNLGLSRRNAVRVEQSKGSARSRFHEKPIDGDSGNPGFLVVGDQPVLLFMFWAPEGGTFITPYKSDIEDVMNGLCPNSTNHYSLQEFDLSAFSKVIEEEPQ